MSSLLLQELTIEAVRHGEGLNAQPGHDQGPDSDDLLPSPLLCVHHLGVSLRRPTPLLPFSSGRLSPERAHTSACSPRILKDRPATAKGPGLPIIGIPRDHDRFGTS